MPGVVLGVGLKQWPRNDAFPTGDKHITPGKQWLLVLCVCYSRIQMRRHLFAWGFRQGLPEEISNPLLFQPPNKAERRQQRRGNEGQQVHGSFALLILKLESAWESWKICWFPVPHFTSIVIQDFYSRDQESATFNKAAWRFWCKWS